MSRARRWLLATIVWLLPTDIAQAAAGDLEEDWRRNRVSSRSLATRKLLREAASLLWCAVRLPRDRRRFSQDDGGGMLSGFLRDLQYAFRLAVRDPRPAVLSALTLALGLGAAMALFSLTNAWLLRPLPFRDAGRLVSVWETIPSESIFENTPAAAVLFEWRERAHDFDALGAMRIASANLTGAGEPERLTAIVAEPVLVDLLGLRAAMGRTFSPDSAAGAPAEVMLTHAFWQRRFNGSRDVVGMSLTLDGESATIVGILPRGVSLLTFEADIWRPLRFTAEQRASLNRNLWVFGRLRAGVPVAQAAAEIDGIARARSKGELGARAVPLQEQTVGSLGRDLPILLGATGVLLLIACANVASFMLARTTSRRREFVIRTALGAGRLRVARQVFTEALPLAVAGGAGGLLLSEWLVRAFQAMLPQGETLPAVSLADGRIFAFGCAASLLTAILFSAGPALLTASGRTMAGIRGGRGFAGRQTPLRVLAGIEVALAVALLIAAGLVGRSFLQLTRVDLGFHPDGLLTFELPRNNPEPAREGSVFFDDLLRRLRDEPAIEHAGITQALPLKSFGFGSNFPVAGVPGSAGNILAYWRTVSPGYFEALGLPLRAGRAFDAHDTTGGERVAIVSESYARRAFPNGDSAIGRRIGWANLERPMTIIGVVADVRLSPAGDPGPHVYMPFSQVAGFLPSDLVVRGMPGVGQAQIIDTVRRAASAVDPLQPVANIRTMDALLWRLLGRRRFQLALWTGFAAAAALLALIGVYGVVSYVVRQSTRELGIRLALGARPSGILWLVLRQGSLIAATGALAGVIVAYWSASVIGGFLIRVEPRDPLLYAAVVLSVIAAAGTACAVPARRAAGVDPIVALRSE